MKKRIHFLVVFACLLICLTGSLTVYAGEDNTYDRYEAKQIILDAVLEEYEGAKAIYAYPNHGKTIISFKTRQDTKEAYEKLLATYGSEKCYLDRIYKAEDLIQDSSTGTSYQANSWGTSLMGMDYLKSNIKSYGINRKVTVAVIDTGVNKNNTVFKGRTIKGYNTMLGKAVYNDIAPQFPGHGTHVCGIIADATPSNVDFYVLSTFDENGENTGGSLIAAFYLAIDEGADLINCCLGYDDCDVPFLDDIIEEAYYKKIPVIVAAGNSQANVNTMYPASNSKVIAVSALKKSGTSVAFDNSYSNYGGKIDFSGPGTDILSASKTSNTSKVLMSGTSMAAPHITAAFAWMKLLYPNDSVAKLYARMKKYSQDLGTKGKDVYYGNGLPRLKNLLSNYRKDKIKAQKVAARKKAIAKLKSSKVNLRQVYVNSKNQMTVKWTRKTGVQGYQISFSRSKKFTGTKRTVNVTGASKQRAVIKKLTSKKTYFVRIRAYKVIDKKTYYSSWSKIKRVRTR